MAAVEERRPEYTSVQRKHSRIPEDIPAVLPLDHAEYINHDLYVSECQQSQLNL